MHKHIFGPVNLMAKGRCWFFEFFGVYLNFEKFFYRIEGLFCRKGIGDSEIYASVNEGGRYAKIETH